MDEQSLPTQRKRQIFISHSYADNEACLALAAALTKTGYSVWLDVEQDYAGQELSQVVREALVASDVLLVVLSDAALYSEWVPKEYEFFRDYGNRARRILSVKVAPCELHPMPQLSLDSLEERRFLSLENLAAIDATHRSLDEVVALLDRHIASSTYRIGRTKLTTLTEQELTRLIRDLLPAIYGAGNIPNAQIAVSDKFVRTYLDIVASNSYTLFPGRYIIEIKAWNSASLTKRGVEGVVSQLVRETQVFAESLEHIGVDEEVFAFLFTPAEVPIKVRKDAFQYGVRVVDGKRLVTLLRENGFDVEL